MVSTPNKCSELQHFALVIFVSQMCCHILTLCKCTSTLSIMWHFSELWITIRCEQKVWGNLRSGKWKEKSEKGNRNLKYFRRAQLSKNGNRPCWIRMKLKRVNYIQITHNTFSYKCSFITPPIIFDYLCW